MTRRAAIFMLTIMCLPFVAVGLIKGYVAWKQISGSLIAQGKVVGFTNSAEVGKSYDPDVEYQVGEKTYRIVGRCVLSFYPAYSSNETVTVLYHPDRPQDGTINSFTELWLDASVFGGIGIFGFIFFLIFIIRGFASDQESEPDGEALPEGGGLPGEAYSQAAKAMQAAKSVDKLVEVIKASTTASQATGMRLPQRSLDEQREQGVLNVLRSLYVIENPRVEGGFIDSDKATLFISGSQKGRKVSQKLQMQFEMGQWKMGVGAIEDSEPG